MRKVVRGHRNGELSSKGRLFEVDTVVNTRRENLMRDKHRKFENFKRNIIIDDNIEDISDRGISFGFRSWEPETHVNFLRKDSNRVCEHSVAFKN
jgi:hypothetical protein